MITTVHYSHPVRVVSYGEIIKLRHVRTGGILHSHNYTCAYPFGSRHQQVTCHPFPDENDEWEICAAHNTVEKSGRNVHMGDAIRLKHRFSGLFLQSNAMYRSPFSGQQEVSCFNGNDENADWILEKSGNHSHPHGEWIVHDKFLLRHRVTGAYLHSNEQYFRLEATDEVHQEATAFEGEDPNNEWQVHKIV